MYFLTHTLQKKFIVMNNNFVNKIYQHTAIFVLS